jgi:hypothetical protein
LILNVDGCIAACFVDLLRDGGAFTREEADEYIKVTPHPIPFTSFFERKAKKRGRLEH